jgi:hypothetical protein
MAADSHGDRFRYARPNQVAYSASAKVVKSRSGCPSSGASPAVLQAVRQDRLNNTNEPAGNFASRIDRYIESVFVEFRGEGKVPCFVILRCAAFQTNDLLRQIDL